MTPTRAILSYELPLAEMIYDLYDKLKSSTPRLRDNGLRGHRLSVPTTFVGLTFWSPGRRLTLCRWSSTARSPNEGAGSWSRSCVPRSTAINSRWPFRRRSAVGVVARETISALRKNVTAKCYGGDISRKRKLLEKQKEGKKRMKQVGNVEISQEAFLSVLDDGDE